MKTHTILAMILIMTALMGCEKKPQVDVAKPAAKEVAPKPATKEAAK